MTYDVAIVGFGPSGMVLAALLGQRGRSVVVLERYEGLYNLPRAACFDDEIMRTFQKLGIVEDVTPGTVVQTEYDWVNGAGETLLDMRYTDRARGGWASLYMMYQPHVEAVLDDVCRSLPSVEVRRGVTVDDLQQDATGVELLGVDSAGAPVNVRARFAIGADGGGGFMREAIGTTVSDYAFSENWLVCDFRKHHELADVPQFRQVCDPAQPHSIVRIGPHHHRFSFALEADEPPERATDPERVWARVAPYLGPEDAELIRVANYTFRSRIADRWRDGRVLLAGDAAHEMPPFLAQGMCSGIRDSHNLAWKLDLVLSGEADAAVLDTYQAEREPHVRTITERANELGRVQTLRDPVAARERDERLKAQRRARGDHEQILYPGLVDGLLDAGGAHAGDVFPQDVVAAKGGPPDRFDDLVGPGPSIVVRSSAVLAALDERRREDWSALGGNVALVVGDGADASPTGDDVIVLSDVGRSYAAWFDSHSCEAAVVRPDWYLYGTATDAAGLADLVSNMRQALRAGIPA